MFITSCLLSTSAPQTNGGKTCKNNSKLIQEETISIVKRVNTTDTKRSNVILDLAKETVVKCRSYAINNVAVITPDYHELLEHFRSLHPEVIDLAIQLSKPVTTINDSTSSNSQEIS